MKKQTNRRRSGRGRRTISSAMELVGDVTGGVQIYRRGVEAGVAWAEQAGPEAASRYATVEAADVDVAVWRRETMPEGSGPIVSFSGGFQPPDDYDVEGLPDDSIEDTEAGTVLYWMGWLDGVHEVLARHELEPLLAPERRRVLLMDHPRPGECPICWIERNLGVKVVIREDPEGGEARAR